MFVEINIMSVQQFSHPVGGPVPVPLCFISGLLCYGSVLSY
jgi:hypothetical protein